MRGAGLALGIEATDSSCGNLQHVRSSHAGFTCTPMSLPQSTRSMRFSRSHGGARDGQNRGRRPGGPAGSALVKSMTCREWGGKCDQKLSASSSDEMVRAMTSTCGKAPDVAKEIEKMHNEDFKKWAKQCGASGMKLAVMRISLCCMPPVRIVDRTLPSPLPTNR